MRLQNSYRAFLIPLLGVMLASCGKGGASTPTSPTPAAAPPAAAAPAAPTRIISVTGNLDFGQVNVGSSQSATMTIGNSGNAALTITGLSATGGFVANSSVSFTSGTIAAGASQSVTVTFRPTAAGTFSGTMTVNGDQTSGTNTIAFTASSVDNNPFSGSWSGGYVVERCDGSGSLQDILCSAPSGSRPGGVFPVGTTLPITLTLTQNGGTVTGTWALGTVAGTATGTIVNGTMTLQGNAANGTLSAAITAFSATVSGRTMSGTASYSLGVAGVPGTGVLVTRLTGVTK